MNILTQSYSKPLICTKGSQDAEYNRTCLGLCSQLLCFKTIEKLYDYDSHTCGSEKNSQYVKVSIAKTPMGHKEHLSEEICKVVIVIKNEKKTDKNRPIAPFSKTKINNN